MNYVQPFYIDTYSSLKDASIEARLCTKSLSDSSRRSDYKVITHPKTNTHIAFLMKNKYYQINERVLSKYLVSIDKIESLSRLDLFRELHLKEDKERVGDEFGCKGL